LPSLTGVCGSGTDGRGEWNAVATISMMRTLTIESRGERQVIDITDEVHKAIAEAGATDGVCHLFVMHTTAALMVLDMDAGTDLDFLDALDGMLPEVEWRHGLGDKHATDHILSALIGPSLLVPVRSGLLRLGIWQRIVLLELDGPRSRRISVSVLDMD
jgi:secondary thiamine-phosphate synthase enzyme